MHTTTQQVLIHCDEYLCSYHHLSTDGSAARRMATRAHAQPLQSHPRAHARARAAADALPYAYACRDIKIVVFDEADEMWAAEGFAADSLKILKCIRDGKGNFQVLLFSATFSDKVRAFAEKLVGPQANKVFVPREVLSLDVIKQYRVACPTVAAKEAVLKDLIFPNCEKLGQTIIFVRSREMVRRLHDTLERDGHKCTSISGSKTGEERDAVIREFRAGSTKILISTDVLSRGFDHAAVTLVVNFDPPVTRSNTPGFETYMHRIGRSGRFGRKGAAFNLVATEEERRVVDAIGAHFQHDIPPVTYNDEDAFQAALKQAGLM
jgi:ATP-dependent RNA helicase DDX19/DBP5